MKTFRLISMIALVFALGVATTSCVNVKDADVQAAAQTALSANPDLAEVSVTVSQQVATLSGTVENEVAKALAETTVQAVENVKSVVNNVEIVEPAPDYTELDAAINAALADALKDHAKVEAAVLDGVITLTGEISEKDLPKLMETISALNPVQIENNLEVK